MKILDAVRRLRRSVGGAARLFSVGDTVAVDVRRDGAPQRVLVPITSYSRSRVRFVDVPNVSPAQRAWRARWLAGR